MDGDAGLCESRGEMAEAAIALRLEEREPHPFAANDPLFDEEDLNDD